MILYFIRHGEKQNDKPVNPLFKHYDPGLTDNGVVQAASLVEYFKEKDVTKIYSSQYLRAVQTAQPLSKNKHLQVINDKRLNEIDNGVIEMMSDAEIEREYPDFWEAFWNRQTDCRFPGGETGEEVKQRQADLLGELKQQGENCILFTHEGYIRLLMCHILSIPVYHRYKFQYDFCGITEIFTDKKTNEWRIARFNHTTY